MSAHVFHCFDAHTCGNPVRLVARGGPVLSGENMSEKRQHFLREFDWIRQGLMFEPRGHDMMSGCILYPPSDPSSDTGILFIETSGCLPMCGHGTIGAVTIALEKGLVKPKNPGSLKLETPAGRVAVEYRENAGKVSWVRFTNVPSFMAAQNLKINSTVLGELWFDVAYGGNFYAIIDPQKNFGGIENFSASQLIQMSPEIRNQINSTFSDAFIHPEDETIRDVSHILWAGQTLSKNATARNAVFYGDKAIDRSPCGTGTSARMAQWFAKGKLKLGEPFVHDSFIGSQFVGTILHETRVGDYPAIIPSIQGWAKIYGENIITIDEDDDPYAHGFQVI